MTELVDLDLPSGRLRVERTGPAGAPATVCVHGLTANVRSFDALRAPLTDRGRQVVAMDLRGRGRSPDTGPGTYGLDRHGDDILSLADALELAEFDYVGWSMGALIGLRLALRAGERMRTVTLIDALGGMDADAMEAVRAATERLDVVVPDRETYFTALRASGVFDPWDPFWERYFGYELVEVEGGLSPSTSRPATLEDLAQADIDFRPCWDALTQPTLLLWASEPLGGGLLVPTEVRDAFLAAAPTARLHAVDRNHYGIMIEPGVAEAIAAHIAEG